MRSPRPRAPSCGERPGADAVQETRAQPKRHCRPVKPGHPRGGRRRRVLRSLSLLLALALLPGAAGDGLEAYRPRHRSAAELAPIAAELLAPEGSAIVDPGTGTLILRGPREALIETLALLRRLDVPFPTYRVEAVLTRLGELERLEIAVESWIRAGELRVGTVPGHPRKLALRARSVLAEGEERFEGELVVREGQGGEFWTGTTHPERVQTAQERAGELRGYESSTLVPVRTGLRAVPRGHADGTVELAIAPVVAEPGPERSVLRTAAAAHVRLRPGQMAVVASIQQAESRTAIDPFAALDLREGASQAVLLVRVERLPDP